MRLQFVAVRAAAGSASRSPLGPASVHPGAAWRARRPSSGRAGRSAAPRGRRRTARRRGATLQQLRHRWTIISTYLARRAASSPVSVRRGPPASPCAGLGPRPGLRRQGREVGIVGADDDAAMPRRVGVEPHECRRLTSPPRDPRRWRSAAPRHPGSPAPPCPPRRSSARGPAPAVPRPPGAAALASPLRPPRSRGSAVLSSGWAWLASPGGRAQLG